uniref:RNA-directed DNA polymerase n=1 Tax=Blueberry red ringspot virus TaxID=172220 RepID=A0A6H1NPY0_9VIRU|nr:putative reverse transcriptase [Blueberry red ringspot virus]QIZ03263.1 putative reverse transcriptase [Blueberry red ringspot virus]QIZ03271.1 putative reverse transcriptase [Blueberry red ringspot virus]QIZ03279.1 putative reverse transcriptase [Blueberry red ringspot virus]QIZ03295.1 putative reverse transcriptase [Blueberry red ringspot virus]
MMKSQKKKIVQMNQNNTFIKITISQKTILAYIDTGASLCLLPEYNLPKLLWKELKKPITIRVADKRELQITKVALMITILIEKRKFLVPTIYQFDSGVPMIIGNNFLRLYYPFCQYLSYITLRCPKMINQKQEVIKIPIHHSSQLIKAKLLNLVINIEEQLLMEQVNKILQERFSLDLLGEKNKNKELIEIKLKDPNAEIFVPNNIPYTQRDIEEFKEDMEDLINKGLIRPSKSPHSAPAFYVENHSEIKRAKRRIVINYKAMNEATIGTPKTLPRSDYIMNRLKGKIWFSTLDVKSAYWQLRLTEESKPLTAFSYPPQKHYEWNVLPMGLKQAPGIFQEFMNRSLHNLEHICLVYVDDIIIFSEKDKNDHLSKVLQVLKRCADEGIILSQPKAKIAHKEIDFFGLHISEGEIILQPHILEKLVLFPDEIENRKQLQRFLGNLNYISEKGFIKDFAKYRKELQKKVSEKVPWKWTSYDTTQVQALKALCQRLPKLYNAKESDLLIIATDASNGHWGAVMTAVTPVHITNYGISFEDLFPKEQHTAQALSSQYQFFGTKDFVQKELLTKYASGTFTDTEKRYPIHELETLAVLQTFRKWKVDLLSKPFILKTDSKYVTGFLRYKIKANYNQGRLIRWQLELSQFNYRTFYIKGSENYGPDTLTREWKEL